MMRMKRFLMMLALLTTAATSLWAQTYKVKMKNGTPDVSNWTITPPEASTTGVTVGSRVEVKYSGERRVKRALAKYKDAEGHALESAAVGELICSDGLAYAAADKKRLPTGVTAAALIVSMNGSHGLALALYDSEKMDWPTANNATSGAAAYTPVVAGCTWKLASKDEWDMMIEAAGGAQTLRECFEMVGGTNLDGWYWSSSANGNNQAWVYNFYMKQWASDARGEKNSVRACIAF